MNVKSLIPFLVGGLCGAATGPLYVHFFGQNQSAIAAALELPSDAEATAAMNKAKNNVFPKSTVKIGQCDKDSMGPGARCTVTWDLDGDGAHTKAAIVGFSRDAGGQWLAVHYY